MASRAWQYNVTAYTWKELVGEASGRERVFACAEDGACRADELGTLERGAITARMNQQGEQGWEIVQVRLNESGLVCFWKRPSQG